MKLKAMAMLAFGLITCFLSGADSGPCPSATVELHINSTADVQTLTDALSCMGEGIFSITWHGSLAIDEVIKVSDKKNVTVTGAGSATFRDAFGDDDGDGAVIDARTGTSIFSVSNVSTLRLNNLVLAGGKAENGGAVAVFSSSALVVFDCTFTSNIASNGGETPPLVCDTYFDGKLQSRTHISGAALLEVGGCFKQNTQIVPASNCACDSPFFVEGPGPTPSARPFIDEA
ncbi:MAG: hypothetical protein ABJO54_15540 [Hyphomicrobiales bacterium]